MSDFGTFRWRAQRVRRAARFLSSFTVHVTRNRVQLQNRLEVLLEEAHIKAWCPQDWGDANTCHLAVTKI